MSGNFASPFRTTFYPRVVQSVANAIMLSGKISKPNTITSDRFNELDIYIVSVLPAKFRRHTNSSPYNDFFRSLSFVKNNFIGT